MARRLMAYVKTLLEQNRGSKCEQSACYLVLFAIRGEARPYRPWHALSPIGQPRSRFTSDLRSGLASMGLGLRLCMRGMLSPLLSSMLAPTGSLTGYANSAPGPMISLAFAPIAA